MKLLETTEPRGSTDVHRNIRLRQCSGRAINFLVPPIPQCFMNYFKSHFIYLFICVGVGWVGVWWMWRLRGNLCESVLSFHQVGPWDQIQVVRLGDNALTHHTISPVWSYLVMRQSEDSMYSVSTGKLIKSSNCWFHNGLSETSSPISWVHCSAQICYNGKKKKKPINQQQNSPLVNMYG